MKFPPFAKAVGEALVGSFGVLLLLGPARVRADQVEMSNGDRYVGRVLSLSGETLVLQSEVLGNLRLPRGRISTILLDPRPVAAGTNTAPRALAAPGGKPALTTNNFGKVAGASTNASTEFSAAMRQLGTNSSMLRQVQDQLLTGAGPEAQAKFNDLMGGLLSGKIDLTQLRAEAKTTLEQARRMRGDLGEEGGGMLDSYLSILDGFLKETEPEVSSTNKVPAVSVPAPTPAQKPSAEE